MTTEYENFVLFNDTEGKYVSKDTTEAFLYTDNVNDAAIFEIKFYNTKKYFIATNVITTSKLVVHDETLNDGTNLKLAHEGDYVYFIDQDNPDKLNGGNDEIVESGKPLFSVNIDIPHILKRTFKNVNLRRKYE